MPRVTFSYDYGCGYYQGQDRSNVLLMYADITDDIPYDYISRSCSNDGKACYKMDDSVNRGIENKKLVNVVKELFIKIDPVPEEARHTVSKMERKGSTTRLFGVDLAADISKSERSDALKRARLSDFDPNHNTEKDQTGDASTSVGIFKYGIEQSTKHCLSLKNFLSEFSVLVCLQCLDPGEKDERYLVSFPDKKEHRWALRYTSSEDPKRTMKKCGSLCGDITWGSQDHCLAAHIDYNTGPSSALLANVETLLVVVKYRHTEKEACLRCVRPILKPVVEHNGDDDMHSVFPVSQEVFRSYWWNLLTPCSNHCIEVKSESRHLSKSLSDFYELDSLKPESGYAQSEEESTTSYFCMYISKRPPRNVEGCLNCLKGSKLYKSQNNDVWGTSDASRLIISPKALRVQELAIECSKSCGWLAGLSKPVCDFLQRMAKVHRAYCTESRQVQPEQQFVNVIKSLQAGPFLWYLQFENDDADMKIAFRELAFCIAVVTNAYVVSVTSCYLIVSPFKSEHVKSICNIPDIIRIADLIYVDSGSFSQPLSFQSVTLSLGFSENNTKQPKNLNTERLKIK
ncbi:unnamed protein product [Albugo candida]|nr:unnamed protein product [Albugo candida]|eukprot:CCI10382.1 unnamed protein product [Albugo candida]